MEFKRLSELTGKTVRGWYEWLRERDAGCRSVCFASTDKYRYFVCMGWHDYGEGPDKERGFTDGFRVAWKIGRQTHNNIVQCDLDVDFEMPYDTETGDVDNTLEEVTCGKIVHKPYKCWGKTWHLWRWSVPIGYRDWNALAARMRKVARRVWRDWKDNDE